MVKKKTKKWKFGSILLEMVLVAFCTLLFFLMFSGILSFELGLLNILDFSFIESLSYSQLIFALIGMFLIILGSSIYFGVKVPLKIYKFFKGLTKENKKKK